MKITNNQIKKILKLTASLDPDGSIWGYDTEVYTSFGNYAKDVRRILNQTPRRKKDESKRRSKCNNECN